MSLDFEPEDLPEILPQTKITSRRCRKCKTKFNVPVDAIGKFIRCPACKVPMILRRRFAPLADAGMIGGGCLGVLIYSALQLFILGVIVIIAAFFANWVLGKFGIQVFH